MTCGYVAIADSGAPSYRGATSGTIICSVMRGGAQIG